MQVWAKTTSNWRRGSFKSQILGLWFIKKRKKEFPVLKHYVGEDESTY